MKKKPIKYASSFSKSFRTRIMVSESLVRDYKDALEVFIEDPHALFLRRHALRENLSGLEALSINYEYRVIFRETEDYYLFVDIGSHEDVYL